MFLSLIISWWSVKTDLHFTVIFGTLLWHFAAFTYVNPSVSVFPMLNIAVFTVCLIQWPLHGILPNRGFCTTIMTCIQFCDQLNSHFLSLGFCFASRTVWNLILNNPAISQYYCHFILFSLAETDPWAGEVCRRRQHILHTGRVWTDFILWLHFSHHCSIQ